MRTGFLCLIISAFSLIMFAAEPAVKPIRVLVITGGHDYRKTEFNQMFASFAPEIIFQVAELPSAFDMFMPENRNQYDVLIFYHMWQTITDDQAKNFVDCIKLGKPLVVLHHSICAFDEWPEYWNIIGGKYFHKTTLYKGKEYAPCSYIHDIHFNVEIADKKHPVTKGMNDFPIFDETYKGYYVGEEVTSLLVTDEPSSNSVIGWTKEYGKSNENYRKLLKQAIEWVYKNGSNS
jgi:type 1 glutamine amidotransferase